MYQHDQKPEEEI